jgi:hypothetical protein
MTNTHTPPTQDELAGRRSGFLDHLLDATLPDAFAGRLSKRDYLERALAGGFPEAMTRPDHRGTPGCVLRADRRGAGDPGDSRFSRTAKLPRLLRLVAARQASVLNVADLAADAQLPRSSVQRYLDVLEAVFLSVRLPAWSPNLSQREIRAPKILLTDPGLAAHLRQADVETLVRPELAKGADGPIVEGFAVTELLRQAEWSPRRPRLSHYRDRDTLEVDLVVEARGQVAAVEIKEGAAADPAAVRNLTRLRDQLGDRFAADVVLHTGARGSKLGDRLFALPIAALWEL